MITHTIALWAGLTIPFGWNIYPCPQEYKNDLNFICIVKVDYEK